MTGKAALRLTLMLLPGFTATVTAQAAVDVDAEAAQALAKRNDCFKCHSIDKAKKAPPYNRIAGRLKFKPDAVAVIAEHITSGRLVQLQDGTEVNHRIIDTRDPKELENLARWILSL